MLPVAEKYSFRIMEIKRLFYRGLLGWSNFIENDARLLFLVLIDIAENFCPSIQNQYFGAGRRIRIFP